MNTDISSYVKFFERKLNNQEASDEDALYEDIVDQKALLNFDKRIFQNKNKKEKSDLFYKIEGYNNISKTCKTVEKWLANDEKVISFYSFEDEKNTKSQIISMAAYFEYHKEMKVLIVTENSDYLQEIGIYFKSTNYKNKYKNNTISDYISVVSLESLVSHEMNFDERKKILENFKEEYDLILIQLPTELSEASYDEAKRQITFFCSNVTYITSEHKINAIEFSRVRKIFNDRGISEGGVILGDLNG